MEANPSGITPSFDKIVIEPLVVETKSKGGIVLPDQVVDREQDAARIGTIVAAGDEAKRQLGFDYIGVGDRIVFINYSGHKYPVGGTLYFISKWQNVLGKVAYLPDYLLNGAESQMNTLHAKDGLAINA